MCHQDDSFKDVAHTINRGRLGLALVMEGDELLGLVTDGDVRRAFDSEQDYRAIQAKHIMTADPKVIALALRFAEAEERLRAKKISALVVKSAAGKVVGPLCQTSCRVT